MGYVFEEGNTFEYSTILLFAIKEKLNFYSILLFGQKLKVCRVTFGTLEITAQWAGMGN